MSGDFDFRPWPFISIPLEYRTILWLSVETRQKINLQKFQHFVFLYSCFAIQMSLFKPHTIPNVYGLIKSNKIQETSNYVTICPTENPNH